MRRFARILSVLAVSGLFLSGCADGGVGELEQLANQVPPGASGNGGTGTPVTGGMSGGASGTGAAAGTSGGAAGVSAGTGGTNAAGAGGSSGTGGTSAAGEGGTSGDAASGAGGASGEGASGAGGEGGMTPPLPPPEYLPAADNPPECPATAPEDPVGDCAGLPIYVVCNYGDDNYWYTCTCDWYHWLCAGT